ncbi:peroxiredoxin family protein [Peribacillus simplex]|uniref:peroxiredoxin family protein n=1 Tax=Peribacillus simplex TaxID=1478 RepID=UPI003CEFDE7E
MPTIWIFAYICLWVVVVIEGLIIFTLISSLKKFVLKIQQGNMVDFKRELPLNTLAPAFKVKDQLNNVVKMGPNIGQDTLIVFISSTCSICKMLLENLEKLKIEDRNIIFISEAKIEKSYIKLISEQNYSYIASQQIHQDYNVFNVPKAILISNDGYVQENFPLSSWEDLNTNIKQLA